MRRIKTLHDELNNEHYTYIDGHEASDEELRELREREEDDGED